MVITEKKTNNLIELNSEQIILRITSFSAACGGVSERIKNKKFPYPDKRDKCVNEFAFYQKANPNLLNSRRFPATCCGELQYKGTIDVCQSCYKYTNG